MTEFEAKNPEFKQALAVYAAFRKKENIRDGDGLTFVDWLHMLTELLAEAARERQELWDETAMTPSHLAKATAVRLIAEKIIIETQDSEGRFHRIRENARRIIGCVRGDIQEPLELSEETKQWLKP